VGAIFERLQAGAVVARRALVTGVAAIAEPGFILIAGTVLASIVLPRLGVGDAGHYLYDLRKPDFQTAARIQFFSLAVRYGLVFILAFVVGVMRRRWSLASYGLSNGGRALADLIRVGILLGLFASLPIQILRLANAYLPLGPGTRFWALQARVPWDAGFWLYMAVGSFVVVPIFEEVYARGYLLGRVRESFSAGGALLMMAVFFAFAHGQYHHFNALAAGDEASLLLWSLVLGYAVYRTGSLIPAIIAHAIINTPMTVNFYWALVAISLLALIFCRKAAVSWAVSIIGLLRNIDDWPMTLLGVVVFVAMMMTVGAAPWVPYVWLGVLGLATVPGLFRPSPWSPQSRCD
jgi:membrane protease YdiL (CAAX protease family)